MAQEVFKRYEKKYLLTKLQYEALSFELSRQMEADEYGEHTISNIYFDTCDYELIRQSIERPAYKEKLRLRSYGMADKSSTVFLELKKKYDGIVYKRRIPLRLWEAEQYLYEGIRPGADSQILREIDYVKSRYELSPAAYVSYDRIALYGKEDQELRVTFDKNIRCRSYELDLKKGVFGAQILEKGSTLMEIKIPGAMPVWMSGLLSELSIFPVSFSKYGLFYKKYLIKNILHEGGRSCA